jgi:hypothetical protein
MRHVVAADAAPGHQEIADALRHQRAIGHVPVAPGGGQDEIAIAVDEFGEDADGIVEASLLR